MQSLLNSQHRTCTKLARAFLPQARYSAAAAISSAAALTFDKHGEPAAVMQLNAVQLPELGDSDVQLQILRVSAVGWPCIVASLMSPPWLSCGLHGRDLTHTLGHL